MMKVEGSPTDTIAKDRPEGTLRVVLGMQSNLARLGLEGLLLSIPQVAEVHARSTVQEALDVVVNKKAELLVVALDELSESDCRLLNARPREVRTLLLINNIERAQITLASTIACTGYLHSQELNAKVLKNTIFQLRRNQIPLPRALAKYLISNARAYHAPMTPTNTESVRLTPREREVLGLLVEGFSNKQIADRIAISQHGVKRIVANVLAKLNCPNRTSAVARALAEGLAGHRLPSPDFAQP
ncbi:MAG: hypothetical protein DIU79_13195 [Actinobacteria bacterium]|nr:MAG: hypothetical protein DIU79_13195 [Actinomycetota bacterium]